MTVLLFISLRHLTASLVTIGLYTYPVFVYSLAMPFSNEEVTAGKLVPLGAVLAGGTPIVDADMAGVEPVGVAFALRAAGCYALYTTASRAIVTVIRPRAPHIWRSARNRGSAWLASGRSRAASRSHVASMSG
jgi:drug/metabolite transporter (DMT)-like permease